jgi:hypothetical protein
MPLRKDTLKFNNYVIRLYGTQHRLPTKATLVDVDFAKQYPLVIVFN